ncbi:unnamed protein product [Cladocopium goreaui]|uniref:Fe2OG dioxygenase domain-containing protein n=1 Tax=Cladocopium goreaui TaxID=2562237 RepID=A0A9P1BFR7_9DINO|nr:unnamed protein product [Cladocopium goreaui]
MAAALQMVHFEEKLQKAMQDVKLILDSEKCMSRMSLPQETHHTYEDKFGLVERCSAMTLASHWNCFELLGLTKEALLEAKDWADGNAEVSLCFRADERCEFLREETREVEEPSCGALDISSVGVALGLMSKTVTRVTEYLWHFEVTYTLDLLRGVGAERRRLTSATTSAQLTTTAKLAPRRMQVPAISKEINMTFFFKHLEPSSDGQPGYCPRFQIPRDSKTKTPRRNQQVEEMWHYLQNLKAFAGSVERYLSQLADGTRQNCSAEAVFVPMLPLLQAEGHPEEGAEQVESRICVRLDADGPGGVISSDCNRLLAEEMRSLAVKRQELSEEFAESHGVFRLQEATLVLALKHCLDVVERWCDSVDFVESLLRRQLSACIGRSLTAADVANCMRFHHRKLFAAPYQPRPFSFSVRSATDRCAEGVVSIDEDGGAPVWTMCARRSEQTMKFALNASTSVSFTGELHLHAWLAERFEGATSNLSLVSRARQFSCFMVLLCKVISGDELEVSHAVLLQNKDEVQIPLELATIPTPKEFRDAIESLSPEQQQFAKAFRAMQLESTLCGILVVQLKPQLERLLRLPVEALTKEIKLTQDLLQLFIKYQIPSDLLAFSPTAEPVGAVEAVRAKAEEMWRMIDAEKQKEIEDKRQAARFAAGMLRPMGWNDQEDLEKARQKVSSLKCISSDIAEVKDTMNRNLDAMLTRGESLEAMMQKSKDLSTSSVQFYKSAKRSNAIGLFASRRGAPSQPAAQTMTKKDRVDRASHSSRSSSTISPSPAMALAEPAPAPPFAPPARPAGPQGVATGDWDVTQVPKQLDEALEKVDAVRPTIITAGEVWTKRSQPEFLAAQKTEKLQKDQIKQEKDSAFELLDALTKSGALALSHATLHVVLCASQCFVLPASPHPKLWKEGIRRPLRRDAQSFWGQWNDGLHFQF